MPLKDFSEILANELKDPNAVAAYLEAALDEGDVETFLVALRNVEKIKGHAARLLETAASRPSGDTTLEKPQFETLQAILNAHGLRFSITRNDSQAAVQA